MFVNSETRLHLEGNGIQWSFPITFNLHVLYVHLKEKSKAIRAVAISE